jgi:hypothetical protein
VLSKSTGLLEHSDLDFTERSTGLGVGLDKLRELYCARESRWATADEYDIHRNGFGVRRLGKYQPLQRKRRLMAAWEHTQSTIRH